MNYLELGPAPCDEPCAQVGDPDYSERSRQESQRYIRMLKKMFPDRPEGVRFTTKSFDHDFGSYREVVVTWEDEAGATFAFSIESRLPAKWDPCNHDPIDVSGVGLRERCEDCGLKLSS